MARFGKQAALEAHKSTKEVECIVSVSDDNCSVNPNTGEPSSYYVEAQRLQDQVSEEDARAGLADSNPYITSKKEYYRDRNGEQKEKTSHTEQISVYGMEKIREAAVNEFDTIKKVFDSVTGEEKDKVVHNYIVKLNVGFGGPGKSAFFYVPKSVNLTEKDERYSFRNMPRQGRELTQEILDRHNEITRLAKEAAQQMYTFNGQGHAQSCGEVQQKAPETAQETISEGGMENTPPEPVSGESGASEGVSEGIQD